MKYAKLHTGEMLAFDPSTPDEAITAHVRKKLSSAGAGDMATGAIQQLAHIANAMSQTGEHGKSASEALAAAAQACRACCDAMENMARQHADDIARLEASNNRNIERLIAAVTARKEIVRDKQGKPVAVETVR